MIQTMQWWAVKGRRGYVANFLSPDEDGALREALRRNMLTPAQDYRAVPVKVTIEEIEQ